MKKPNRVPTDAEIRGQLDQYLHITNGMDVPPRIREITAASLNDRPRLARLLFGGGAVLALAAATAVLVLAAHTPRPGPVAVGASPSVSGTATPTPAATSTPSPTPTATATASPYPTAEYPTADPNPLPTPTSTAGWVTVSAPAGGFSFEIPASWQVNGPCTSPGQAPGDPEFYEVNVGPTVAGCGTDMGMNITAESYLGTDTSYLGTGIRDCTSSSTLTVDGVQGTQCTQISNQPGVNVYSYYVVTGGRVYAIWDDQAPEGETTEANGSWSPADPNLSGFLEMIVAQTWQFHS